MGVLLKIFKKFRKIKEKLWPEVIKSSVKTTSYEEPRGRPKFVKLNATPFPNS